MVNKSVKRLTALVGIPLLACAVGYGGIKSLAQSPSVSIAQQRSESCENNSNTYPVFNVKGQRIQTIVPAGDYTIYRRENDKWVYVAEINPPKDVALAVNVDEEKERRNAIPLEEHLKKQGQDLIRPESEKGKGINKYDLILINPDGSTVRSIDEHDSKGNFIRNRVEPYDRRIERNPSYNKSGFHSTGIKISYEDGPAIGFRNQRQGEELKDVIGPAGDGWMPARN